MKVKSVRQESILKQFYVYFLVASVIPFIILIYILLQSAAGSGMLNVYLNSKVLLLIAGILSVLGFWGTRSFLLKIVTLSNKLKSTNLDKLDKIDKNTLMELAQGDEEIAHLARAFSEIITNLEENVKELKETKTTIYQILSRIGQTVNSIDNFDLLVQFILETMVRSLRAKKGIIVFLDQAKGVLRPKALVGIDKKTVPLELGIGTGALGWVIETKKSLLVPSLDTAHQDPDAIYEPPLIAAPLVVHEQLWGAICISGKAAGGEGESFSEEDLNILTNLAYQIAVSLENFTLNAEVEKIYFETISALALAVEAKDKYSRGHSDRVAKYAVAIAEYLHLSSEDLSTLRDAARLHDIGKIGITDEILHKPGKLNTQEIQIMHKHPEIGEGIVKPLRNFRHIIEPIKHHHEFLNGNGYPDGISDGNIPFITRILTVADIFDAMISDRPYRKALSIDMAKSELESMSKEGKIDNEVVDALLNLVKENKLP
ncbi:MAG: HD domain-containing protein [Candidatus Omnitrophota bacterium]|jgi:HD-GYP domain-containing protein (c-di-GMP phosphodiesterase class II)|nr:MAG: HD domain-containing protein [Candidatus Omnitrophota bacterium]